MYEVIFFVGFGLLVIGGIGLLITAFRVNILWGLAILLIAPVAIIFLVLHWDDGKGPFKVQVLGILIMAAFAYMNDGISSMKFLDLSLTGVEISKPMYSNSPSLDVQNQQFKCDGRTLCSQMTSCAEAIFFLQNCPNTKMDGDNDGIPCERQWCR